MPTSTGGSFCTITFSYFGMLPFLNFLLIEEFEKTHASCTEPGHFMDTSIKQYLWSATTWIFKEYLPLSLMWSEEFSEGPFIAMCVPSTAPRHCGKPCFSTNEEQDSLTSSYVRGNLILFVSKMIWNPFCHLSNDHRYCILSNSKCICSFSKSSLVRKIIHFNSNLHHHRNRFLKSCRNLVFPLMYWQSYLHKTRSYCFDIRKFSLHSSAITSSLKPPLLCTSRANPILSFFSFTLFLFFRNNFIT